MDLTSKRIIKNLLEKYGTRPFKGWGQNFLIDKQVLRKIIESANLSPGDTVLEIGPGIGTLTQELVKRARKIIAIEKDQKMCEILKDLLECWKVRNVKIVKSDILKLDPKTHTLKPYKIVANLPYYIVSPVIRKFLELPEARPREMILMVQKEVAQRICAKPPDMSLLAVSVQFYSKPEILFYVPKNSFWPQPKVDSAVIKIVPKKPTTRPGLVVDKDLFFRVVKAGFAQPRKQLVNNLSKVLKLDKGAVKRWLLENGVESTQRAETLTIEDWVKLTRTFDF